MYPVTPNSRRKLFIFALLFIWLTASCSPASPAIKVILPAASPKTGETFQVTIQAENMTNLTALEAHLSFDPAILEVANLTLQEALLYPDFVVDNRYDNSAGTVDYAVAQLNRKPASGSGGLLTIEFRAKSAGSSPLHFRPTAANPAGALLSDPAGKAIPVSLTGAEVTVNP